jgi:hypothetical protein
MEALTFPLSGRCEGEGLGELFVQFLKELWLVLKAVPYLANRYKKQSYVAATTLLLALTSDLVKNKLFASASTTASVLTWTSRVSLGLTGLVFLLAFLDLMKNRLSLTDLVCANASVDAYYHEPKDQLYELVKRLECTNRTDLPIRSLASIRDGYYEEIPDWSIQHALLEKPSVELLIHMPSKGIPRGSNFPGGNKNIYFYEASAEFNPPLPVGSKFDLVYRITAKGTSIEELAFSNEGTLLAVGVDYDTLSYQINVHAPMGYKISLRVWGVVDANGIQNASETDRQKKPKVSTSGGLLQWQIYLAKRHLRYMLKYRFEPYGWR